MSLITFDGEQKFIIISDVGDVTVTAKEIYSRWKDWVLDGNSFWVEAFRTFGGDPLGGGNFAGDYYFLNNTGNWRIKPEEKNHILTINGNLYGEDPNTSIFTQTNGNFNVNIKQNLSSLTQTATFNSGSGLSPDQENQLNELQLKIGELYKIHGLLNGTPLQVNPNFRISGDISQNISQSGNTVTVIRI